MQLADLEYFYVGKEMNGRFKGSRIGKIYQVTKKLFKFQVSNEDGKFTILIQLPDYITFTKRDVPAPEQPSNFIMALRKRLTNGIIEGIEQPRFERIIIINIRAQGRPYKLVIELFSNGNILLCDPDKGDAIDVLYRKESWRDRELGRGERYRLPPSKLSPFTAELKHISLNGKRTLMAGILSQISVAPKYLEEAFVRAGVDPKAVVEPHPEEKERLFYMIKGVCAEGNYYSYSKDGKIVDYAVAHLTKYEGQDYERKEYDSVLEMIDAVYVPSLANVEEEENRLEKRRDERAQQEFAVGKMKERLHELDSEERTTRASAAHMYKNYQRIEQLILLARGMRKQGKSEQEISKAISHIERDAYFKNGMIVLRIKV
jgi:predicted ribosome quality control (RQC) complex YloA/Tae2 family protein